MRTPAGGVTSSASLALALARLSRGTPNVSFLLHSVGNRSQGSEVDVGLVYADYYFIEALLRRRGFFLE